MGIGLVTTPPFIGPFCRSVGAQATTQSWHTDLLTLGRAESAPSIAVFWVHFRHDWTGQWVELTFTYKFSEVVVLNRATSYPLRMKSRLCSGLRQPGHVGLKRARCKFSPDYFFTGRSRRLVAPSELGTSIT